MYMCIHIYVYVYVYLYLSAYSEFFSCNVSYILWPLLPLIHPTSNTCWISTPLFKLNVSVVYLMMSFFLPQI